MILHIDFARPLYNPPYGTPVYWRNDVSGILRAAITAYLNHSIDPARCPPPTQQQLGDMIAFLRYFIHAPCWEIDANAYATQKLAELRQQAAAMTTVEEVRVLMLCPLVPTSRASFPAGKHQKAWLWKCIGLGIDPL